MVCQQTSPSSVAPVCGAISLYRASVSLISSVAPVSGASSLYWAPISFISGVAPVRGAHSLYRAPVSFFCHVAPIWGACYLYRSQGSFISSVTLVSNTPKHITMPPGLPRCNVLSASAPAVRSEVALALPGQGCRAVSLTAEGLRISLLWLPPLAWDPKLHIYPLDGH